MLHAAIDVGNTRCKIGFFENDNLQKVLGNVPLEEVPAEVLRTKPVAAIISSVGNNVEELVERLSTACKTVLVHAEMPLPIVLDYASKSTLGTDRIAAAAAAFHLYGGNNCLVIDVGSCITYDVVTADGVYKGGAISPGVEMKLKAMHTFTARLPLVEHPKWSPLPGNDTLTSMQDGVLHGTLAEIEGMIDRFSGMYADLQVIICGGGSNFFESKIKHHIFVRSEMVLIGLNSILRHNERN